MLVALLLALPAGALPLEEAVRIGVARDPRVQGAVAEVQQSEGELSVSRTGYWPTVSAWTGPQSGGTAYEVTIAQMLYDFGRVRSRVDAGSARVREALASLAVTREEVALEVAEVWLGLREAAALVAAIESHLGRLDELEALGRQRGEGGYADRSELARIRSRLGAVEAELALAQSEQGDLQAQFLELVGRLPQGPMPEPRAFDLLGPLPGPAALDAAVAAAPAVVRDRAAEDAAEAGIAEAEASRWPQLNLEGSVLRREIGGRLTNDSTIALRLRMDAFQGPSTWRRVGVERSRREVAQFQVQRSRREIRRAVGVLAATLPPLRARRRALEEQVVELERTREVYMDQFLVGMRGVADLLTVESEWLQATRERITLDAEPLRLQYRAAAHLGRLADHLQAASLHGDAG
uniref:TolC family protein n=1 Tax=Coralloluteibacterium stylophorae TaxID=1776034 RepID=A0A8J8AYU4_9GAMM